MSFVFESLDEFLFEDLGNLKKFNLPGDLIKKIMSGSGYTSRIGGRDSQVDLIKNPHDYKTLTAALKPDFTAGIISIDGKATYFFLRESERKFKLFDIEAIRQYEENRRKRDLERKARQNESLNEGRSRRGWYAQETGLVGEYSAQTLSEFIKEKGKDKEITVELIRPDVERAETKKERWESKAKNVDPLSSENTGYSRTSSPSQRGRYEKYATKKRFGIDKKVDDTREKLRSQILGNFDKAFDEILKNLRQGYAFYADPKSLADKMMQGVDFSGLKTLAQAYDAVEPGKTSPEDTAKASRILKQTGYL
jgi:hypothetical protein